MIKIFKYIFQAFFVYLFLLISRVIGLNFSRELFSFIFKKVGPIIRSDIIIEKNLKIYKKNLLVKEINSIKSKMWSNYGMTFVEYIFLNKFKKEDNHISIVGSDILDEIIKKDKPVIFVSGHFANFELMSMELTKKKVNLATIYRPLNNFFLNFFMEYLRKKYVCTNQIKKGRSGVKKTIEYINKKYSVALMIDQRVSEGEMIDFFNIKALTSTLPAQLSKKFNLDIVPIFLERKYNNNFEMTINKPIEFSKSDNKLEVTKKLNNVLEDMIRKNPNQWIWTHNRWK
tara:strand:- start:1317 stop:2174 length:858 start_codon:yes stop_codon:yes gene_type:complete